jgi:uncharacterized membrane protein YdjX (TVP38/TMEM64 family)
MSKSTDLQASANKKRKLIALGGLLLFAAILVALTVFISGRFDELARDPHVFREWISSFGIWSRVIYVGLAALQVVLAVIPGGPVQIASGYTFGILEGSLLCIAGIQLGSAIAFLLARYFGIKVIELFFSKEKIDSLSFLNDSKRLDLIVFICFLIPGVPKDLLTYACGITGIRFAKFILLTTIARLPSIVISVISGNALIEENYLSAVIIIVSLAICSLIGFILYRELTKGNKCL